MNPPSPFPFISDRARAFLQDPKVLGTRRISLTAMALGEQSSQDSADASKLDLFPVSADASKLELCLVSADVSKLDLFPVIADASNVQPSEQASAIIMKPPVAFKRPWNALRPLFQTKLQMCGFTADIWDLSHTASGSTKVWTSPQLANFKCQRSLSVSSSYHGQPKTVAAQTIEEFYKSLGITEQDFMRKGGHITRLVAEQKWMFLTDTQQALAMSLGIKDGGEWDDMLNSNSLRFAQPFWSTVTVPIPPSMFPPNYTRTVITEAETSAKLQLQVARLQANIVYQQNKVTALQAGEELSTVTRPKVVTPVPSTELDGEAEIDDTPVTWDVILHLHSLCHT